MVKPRRSWTETLLNFFRLTAQPTLKLYHGYGNESRLTVFGHVFRLSPFPRQHYRHSFVRNTLALLRLFLVKPYAGVEVVLDWKGQKHKAIADAEGFFKIDWTDPQLTETGWLAVEAKAYAKGKQIATATGRIDVADPGRLLIISDIDDTFLISHSANMRKRLLVMFTQNARTRKPFEGVVRHYQLLAKAQASEEKPNPFFYVSSSEWNLYEYILEFTSVNHIPRGVFLLNTLKRFSQLLKTGQNNHGTKFTRIVRILEAFPNHGIVLLGDSSQHDPFIYESIVSHYPHRVRAVYIRDVFERNIAPVKEALAHIKGAGIPCLLFEHSRDAILHSVDIGLIKAEDADEKLAVPKAQAIKMA